MNYNLFELRKNCIFKCKTVENAALIFVQIIILKVGFSHPTDFLLQWKYYRLGEERYTVMHIHLNTSLKPILGELLSCTLNMSTAHLIFGLK